MEFSQAHFDFHMELARQSGSGLLVQNLNRIHFRSWLLWHDFRVSRRRKWMNHSKLVDVLMTAREAEAIDAVRLHINAGLQEELAELKKAT
jgi:DNA-binding GntR family transcriptional regulator